MNGGFADFVRLRYATLPQRGLSRGPVGRRYEVGHKTEHNEGALDEAGVFCWSTETEPLEFVSTR